MTIAPRADEVRRLVARNFRDLGVPVFNLADLHETVLVERRRCIARTYRAGPLMAMWMLDVGLVQFYDDEGNMLRTVNLFEQARTDRAAA